MAESGPQDALRIDMARAVARLALPEVTETGPARAGSHHPDPARMVAEIGDVVLARRDIATSYHLAVVVDDAGEGITEVVRGEDLFAATFIHVLLQAALGLPTPAYHHHRLIRDKAGRRLAKRDDAQAIAKYRVEGATSQDLRFLVGLG
jgi:glutamyl-Q tRNA(Asp) synthetase